MKKIVFSLVVLLFAAPALAVNVTIDACDIGGGEVEIRYVTDGNLPRAFGLDITVSDGNIIDCVPAMVGECNDVLQGFGIFPGTIQIDTGGTVTDVGTPVAPFDDPGALDGLDSDGITIEMGSLYVDGNEPGTSGLLCTITVTEDCTVTIEGNAARCGDGNPARGVIMEDPAEVPEVFYPPGSVVIDCMDSAHPAYAAWVAAGKPDCWCYEFNCRGDADGLMQFGYKVLSDDLAILASAYAQALGPGDARHCADFDRLAQFGYRVLSDDLAILAASYAKAVTSCDGTDINFWIVP